MANVKYGADIKNNGDLQNLITGLILRMRKPYTLSSMVNLVAKFNKGSEVKITKRELTQMVEETLDLFQRNDLVSCMDGEYTTRVVELMDIRELRQSVDTQQTSKDDSVLEK